jgi:hypothetical protein
MFKQSYPVPAPYIFAQPISAPSPVVIHLVTGLNPIPVKAAIGRLLVVRFKVAGITPAGPAPTGFSEGYITVNDTSAIIQQGQWTGGVGVSPSIDSNGDLQLEVTAGSNSPTAVWLEILELTLYGVI